MMKIYKTADEQGFFREISRIEKGCWINLVAPNVQEINTLCNSIGVREDFLRYPLDQEEKARIDVEDDQVLIIADVPIIESGDKETEGLFSTMPLGMIVVKDDYFITVCTKENAILEEFINCKVKNFYTFKKTRFILQILFKMATYYLTYLKYINRETDKAENRLQKSMKNQELIKLLSLEKSLVYFTTSLKSNEIVMEKLLRGNYIKMYEEDEDILEDAIVENKQAIEMGTIYRDILSGTMDAYASVISNNLNIVMKFLASITIVLSIPTIVASLWGMNVQGLPFAENPYGFIIILGIAVVISVGAYVYMKKKDML
ncbi:MAG: magnesium transporter CorA family protein [Clostridia bacterium]|nr:magnesium transporter CorA family protein [Clostridia bacterium]